MSIEINRLLLQLEETMKMVNKEIIRPEIPTLTMDQLSPVIRLTARTRAAYLKELLHTATHTNTEVPSTEQIEKLRTLRVTYEECVAGAQALETAIQREYLEIN